jgi:DNA-binding Lrp family transcriptional regulator
MKRSATLDVTDLKILRELQNNGRLTNVELASRIGLSPPPCLRRVQALEQRGYIAGYRALLDAAKLGFDVQLFAMVGLKSQSVAELRSFEALVAAWPLVREAYAISGEADFILRCLGSDLAELQDFIIKTLTSAPNVDSVKTTMIMGVSKYEPGVPLR